MKNKLIFCLAIFIASFGIKTADATNFTWNVTGAGNWNTPGSWNVGAGYPGSMAGRTDNVTISGIATVTLLAGTALPGTIGTITITATGGTLKLLENLTATGLVTINGVGITLSSGSTLFCNSFSNTSGTAFSLNTPLNVTGLLSSTILTSNASGTINAGSMTVSGTTTLGASLTVTGLLTDNAPNPPSSITGSGAISAGSLTTTAATAISTTGTVTVSGATSITTGTATISGTSLFQTASLQISGVTAAFSVPVSITAGNLTGVSGTSIYTNTKATTVTGNITITAGTLEIEDVISVTGTSGNSLAANTLELNGCTLTTGAVTTPGPVIIAGTNSISTGGTTNTMSGGITFSAANANLTFLGTGSTTITSTTALSSSGTALTIGSAGSPNTTVNFGAGSTLNISNSNASITNFANLNFNGTSGSLAKISITSSGADITNTGSFSGSALTITTTNAGSGATISNSSPGTFTLNGGSSISFLGATDKITNSGIFNAGTSNSACAITLNAATNSITNTSTFNLGSTSIITLTNGTVANNGSGVFTLESDQFGSASIGQAGSTSDTFTGTYNVQRYLSGGDIKYRSYRLLSSPVNLTSTSGVGDISINYLNTNQPIVDPNGSTSTVVNNGALTAGPGGGTGAGFTIYNFYPTLYLYTESNVVNDASLVSGKYVGISAFSGTNVFYESTQLAGGTSATAVPIPVGNGYLMYFIGNNTSTNTATTRVPEATTLTATGLLNQQSVAVTIGTWSIATGKLSYTVAFSGNNNGIGNGLGSAGFNLVGNPYASVIDLKVVYSDNNAQGYTTFYELNDVDPSQGYVSYNGKTGMSSSTLLSSEYIASGQGFIVQATTTGQSITFKEGEKVYSASGIVNSASSPPIFLTAPQRPAPGLNNLNAVSQPAKTRSIVEPSGLIGLHLMLQQSSSVFRECGIYFNKGWSDNYDSNDAYDLGGGSLQMSSFTADGVRTGINALGDYTKGKSVKLYVQAVTDGNYNLNLEDIANIDTTLFNIYLIDHKSQDSLDIVRNKTYAFTITNADTTSFGANRFTLDIGRKPLPAYQLISFTAQKVKDGVELTWKTTNEGDYTGFGIQKLEDNKQYIPLYKVQSDGDGTYTYTDPHPVKGENTYRLQQINIDSLVSYSKPLNILYNAAGTNSNLLSVYPNPAREQITVNFNSTGSSQTGSYFSYIYNSEGRLVMQQTASGNTWTQDVSALRPGAYVIKVKTADGNSIGNSKFVRVP